MISIELVLATITLSEKATLKDIAKIQAAVERAGYRARLFVDAKAIKVYKQDGDKDG